MKAQSARIKEQFEVIGVDHDECRNINDWKRWIWWIWKTPNPVGDYEFRDCPQHQEAVHRVSHAQPGSSDLCEEHESQDWRSCSEQDVCM